MKAPLFKPKGMSDDEFCCLLSDEVSGLTPDELSRWLDEREKAMGIEDRWRTIEFTPEAAEFFHQTFGVTVEEVRKRNRRIGN
jgi:hypothetical protein